MRRSSTLGKLRSGSTPTLSIEAQGRPNNTLQVQRTRFDGADGFVPPAQFNLAFGRKPADR